MLLIKNSVQTIKDRIKDHVETKRTPGVCTRVTRLISAVLFKCHLRDGATMPLITANLFQVEISSGKFCPDNSTAVIDKINLLLIQPEIYDRNQKLRFKKPSDSIDLHSKVSVTIVN